MSKPLRTDQKFAQYLLPTLHPARSGYEGRLCVLYNTLKTQWSVDQIRVVAKLAKGQTFNSIDHISGWFVNALRNQSKGKPIESRYWVRCKNMPVASDDPEMPAWYREILPRWFVCEGQREVEGPFNTREEADARVQELVG